jgi:hypothetical protein
VVEDFTAYKNRNSGIWARGQMHLYRNLKMADNGIGFTHATGGGSSLYTSRVVDSLFVGESGNIGNPSEPAELAYGRSLPQPKIPDFPIRGYEFYDSHHELDGNTFINYTDNDTRKTGAISYLLFTSFGMSSNNTVQRSTFENAKPVYYPPIDNRWSNDDYGNAVYLSSVFNDRDGTITGIPNSYIINETGIDPDEACEARPAWNAYVCTGDIGRMSVGGGGGPLGFGGGGGATVEIAPGGGRIRGVRPPSIPVVLSRNGNEFISDRTTNVRAGTEYRVTTERETLGISLTEMDKGSWVMFELPGFTTADTGEEQGSLEALRMAATTSYFKGDDALWVKLVSNGDFRGPGGPPGSAGGPVPGVNMEVSR